MKKHFLLNCIVIVVTLLPFGYLALVWNSLPETVPIHFGADLKPDRTGSKDNLWLMTGIMAGGSILLYFLFQNLHRIDPKRKDAPPSSTFNKLAVGIVVFMTALSFIIIASAKGGVVIRNLLFPLLGLLFAFLGNYMNHIKPNYFAGFRLPWTLSSDDNWRKTHQLAGKLWFAGGMLLAVVSLFMPSHFIFPVFISITVVIVLIPVVYSYRLFKQQSSSAHQ